MQFLHELTAKNPAEKPPCNSPESKLILLKNPPFLKMSENA